MNNQEAIDKMEFCKRAYQRMIDENSQEGVFVGKGFEGKWKADTPLYKVYEDMRDACDMSIKALEQEPLTEEDYIELHDRFGAYVEFVVRDMVSGKGERWTKKSDNNLQYCDRNICLKNEYNGIGCDECEVTKSQDQKKSCNTMDFPNTFDEFVKDYGFKDSKEVYTNGSDLIPVFRVKQWLEHIEPKTGRWIEKYTEDGCGELSSYWACSECGRSVGFNLANIEDVLSDYPYCHCGAKMVEPQERSGE